MMKLLEEYGSNIENFKELNYDESYKLAGILDKIGTAIEAARAINRWEDKAYYNKEADKKHFQFIIDFGTGEHIINSKQEWDSEPLRNDGSIFINE